VPGPTTTPATPQPAATMPAATAPAVATKPANPVEEKLAEKEDKAHTLAKALEKADAWTSLDRFHTDESSLKTFYMAYSPKEIVKIAPHKSTTIGKESVEEFIPETDKDKIDAACKEFEAKRAKDPNYTDSTHIRTEEFDYAVASIAALKNVDKLPQDAQKLVYDIFYKQDHAPRPGETVKLETGETIPVAELGKRTKDEFENLLYAKYALVRAARDTDEVARLEVQNTDVLVYLKTGETDADIALEKLIAERGWQLTPEEKADIEAHKGTRKTTPKAELDIINSINPSSYYLLDDFDENGRNGEKIFVSGANARDARISVAQKILDKQNFPGKFPTTKPGASIAPVPNKTINELPAGMQDKVLAFLSAAPKVKDGNPSVEADPSHNLKIASADPKAQAARKAAYTV